MKRYKRKISDINYNSQLTKEEKILYKKAVKQIEETNKRLVRLEKGIDINKGKYNPKTKRFERSGNVTVIENGKARTMKTTKYVKYDVGTWATKKLLNRLGDYYNKKENKITIPEKNKIDTAELRNIVKATRNFLNSETSTIKGIQKAEQTTKETISNIVNEDLTSNEVETLYNFWNDPDWVDITQYIPPSDLYVILSESYSEEDFIDKIKMYIDEDSLQGDADMKEKLVGIYRKFK